MGPGEVIGAFAGAIALAAATGLILSRVWAARHLGVMDAYEKNNDELARRVTLLESHVERCEKELNAQRFSNITAMAAGVADAIQKSLAPVLGEIKVGLEGVAEAQDAQAEGLGRLIRVASGLQDAVTSLSAHLERRAPETQRGQP